jgi:peptidoglycan/xylan/chitin deacetylase (PgdA/CDA1 family)/glycosyltransferase involved in cell wall biosynthesis
MAHKILHVLSSNFYAGSVSYAVQLAEKQAREGFSVFMITDLFIASDKFQYTQLPVSKRSLKQRYTNIRFLVKFIRKNNISIVHGHSRAASWVAYYAARICRIPMVSTIHGRQFKKSDVYGEYIIGICSNLIEHLKTEMEFEETKLEFIPNGLDIDKIGSIKRTRSGSEIVISVVGRFNGPKGENFAKFVTLVFPALLQKYPGLYINLVGSEWEAFPEEGKSMFASLQDKYGDRISKHGFIQDVFKLMANSDLVIGAGRVAIEALALRVPVMAIGEGCYHGILNKDSIAEAIASNFGDIIPESVYFHPDCELILGDLNDFLDKRPEAENLREYISIYSIDNVYTRVMKTYRKAVIKKIHPRHIPILMYHKVPDLPIDSKHRVFVIKKNFNKHLRFFAMRGLTAITFKDYEAYAAGERPVSLFPKKPFILTFDDGYANIISNVLPLTEKYRFKGVLFLLGDFSVTANFWDKDEAVSSAQLMTTADKAEFVNRGWEIGAHTMSHPHLTEINDEKVKFELTQSRKNIEEVLGTRVISFAYPFGSRNEKVKQFVEEAGFTFGISTDSGGITIEEDRFDVFRVNIFPEDGLFKMYKKTSSWYRAYHKRKKEKSV